jgi:hypothetical protein
MIISRAAAEILLTRSLNSRWELRTAESLIERSIPTRLRIAKRKTHRTLAWGVLGLASDGYRFSLLTLLFSGVFAIIKPHVRIKFRLNL